MLVLIKGLIQEVLNGTSNSDHLRREDQPLPLTKLCNFICTENTGPQKGKKCDASCVPQKAKKLGQN
jgi:hypothetical protein